MFTYKRDFNKQYDEPIKTILRAHNAHFSNINDSSRVFVYVLEGGTLVGALNVSYFWDWVSIGDVFYKDIEVLRHLVIKAWGHYKKKAIGIKLFTSVRMRLDDFVSAGFKLTGSVKLKDNEMLYYAALGSVEHPLEDGYKVLVTEEPISEYQEILDTNTKIFKEEHHIEDASESYDLAAFDGEQCIGGLQGDVYSDMLYINRLAVDPKYRKQYIGSTLMGHAITYAKEKDLYFVMLGTIEFQAKGFYEKLGFEVVYVQENNPKGYKAYTMLKRIK